MPQSGAFFAYPTASLWIKNCHEIHSLLRISVIDHRFDLGIVLVAGPDTALVILGVNAHLVILLALIAGKR